MRNSKWFVAGVLALTLLLINGGLALADPLDNQLDVTLDADFETVNLAPGGATQVVTLKLHPENGDGDQACNIEGSEQQIITVTSSNPSAATVPPTVTFTQCNERTITVTSAAAGSTNITFSIVSNTTGGTYNLDGARFTVVVASTNTAPSVGVTGFTNGASYEKGVDTLPTPACLATDAEDSPITQPSPNVDVSGLNGFGLGTVTVTCDYTDGGGLAAPQASKSYSIVDTTDPSNIQFTGGGISDGGSYSFGSVPSGPSGCTADDAGSGLSGCTVTGGGTSIGDHSFTATATDNAGNDDTATMNYTVTNNPPSVTVTGFTDGASFEKGIQALPTPGCDASDVEDGNSNPTPTVDNSALDAFGLGTVTVTCSVTDAHGAQDSKNKSYSIVDTTDPTNIQFTFANPADEIVDGQSYYFGSVPAGPDGCTADDAGSGLASCGVTGGGTSIGNHSYTATATDNAGNDDTATLGYTILNNPPSVTVTGFTDGASFEKGVATLPTPGCDATDVEDGNSNPTPTVDNSALDTFGLGTVTVTCEVTDTHGAQDSKNKSYSIVDTTDPNNIAFTGGGVTQGATYYFGSVPSGPTGCTADDAGSGLASCDVTGGGTSVGNHSYTATATDNAGNDATATLSYTVAAWTLRGFYSPVDMNNVINSAKAGSTVPLKFEIFSGLTELTATSAIDTFTVARSTACSGAYGGEDAIEQYSTGGTSLRYDTTGGQFIQNWKLPSGANICYRVTMTADDGSSTSALFKSK